MLLFMKTTTNRVTKATAIIISGWKNGKRIEERATVGTREATLRSLRLQGWDRFEIRGA